MRILKSILAISVILLFIGLMPYRADSQIINPYSIRFDGVNDYIAVANHTSLNPASAITIEAWVNLNGFQYYTSIVEKAGRAPNKGYRLEIIYNTVWFTLYHSSGTKQIYTTSALSSSTWNHIAAVYNGTTAYIYINGSLVKSQNFGTITINNTSDSLYIGQDHTAPTSTFFKGRIDEVKIWNIGLTSDQIYSRMYRELPYSEITTNSFYNNLFAYWQFDNASGNAIDSSKNTNTGILRNSPVYDTIAAPVSYGENGLSFDGVYNYVSVSSNNLELSGNFTLETWVKPKSFGDYEPIIDRNLYIPASPPVTQGYSLCVMANQKLSLRIVFVNNQTFELLSSGTISTTSWYHVAATFNGDTVKLYINGILDNEVAINDDILNFFDQEFHIGADNSFPSPQKFFHGDIGEVRIWSTALSESDINTRIDKIIDENDVYWSSLIAYLKLDEGIGLKTYDHSKNENTGTLYNSPNLPLWIEVQNFLKELTWLGISDDWHDASNWNPAIVPYELTNVRIPATSNDPEIYSGNGVARNIDIEADAALEIKKGKTLDIKGNFKIKSSSTYTGSLLNNGTLNVDGKSYFEREVVADGWHYMSTPLSNSISSVFLGMALYRYNEPVGNWIAVGNGVALNPFQGYDVYMKTTNKKVVFQGGSFNNGTYDMNLTRQLDGLNFIGNPYPTTIDWDATSGWTKPNVDNAIYIWRASINDYSSYVGGIETNGGSRYIPPTQGFWVKCNNPLGSTLTIAPAARHSAAFPFRDENQVNELIKLDVEGSGYKDEAAISFNNEATEDFDSRYDAYKLISLNSSVSSIYTESKDNQLLSINSMPVTDAIISIPVFLKVGVSGDLVINSDLSKIAETKNVYLEDTYTSIIHNLRQGGYKFTGKVEDKENRFILHIVPVSKIVDETIGLKQNKDNETIIYSLNKDVYVSVSEKAIVQVYDLMGNKIVESVSDSGMNKINLSRCSTGYYLVNVQEGNRITSQKVFIN